MAYTRFLWQHTPEQTTTITVEENDTPAPLWSKERASRTTSKRPERLNLKKYSSGDKPVEKVYGPLWQPAATLENLVSSPTFSNITENTRSTTPEIEAIEFKEKTWLWMKTVIPTSPQVEDEEIHQPFLWAKSTAARTSSQSPNSCNPPRKFISDAPLAQVSGTLWRKEKPAPPSLWAKPEYYWRLPEIAPKTPLWSREQARRTTCLAPQPLMRYAVRQSDATVAGVSGSLWSVDSALAERVSGGTDWLKRSLACRGVASLPEKVGVLLHTHVKIPPPTELLMQQQQQQQPKLRASGTNVPGASGLWCRETAERTTRLVPERMVDAKVKKIEVTLEKVAGRLWNLEDAALEKAKKAEKIELSVRPVEKWGMVSLEEIEKVKGAKLWVKETAARTTEKMPERVDTKARPAEEVVVKFTGGLWAPAKKKKQMLWQRQIKTVGSYGFPVKKEAMWRKETAKRTTKQIPDRLTLKPKPKKEIRLEKVSGPMWGVKSPAKTHPRSLWQKIQVEMVVDTSSALLWSRAHASRTTAAKPIRAVTAQRLFTEQIVKATGSLWSKNSSSTTITTTRAMWKAKMKPTGLWHPDGLTPTLSILEQARKAPLWIDTPVHRADIFTTIIDSTPLLASRPPVSDNLPPAMGSLWERKIVTTTISTGANGLWGQQPLRVRRGTFASSGSDEIPSPSLSDVSTLEDDISSLSPTFEKAADGEVPDTDALIRSETNVSITEGLWRKRVEEITAAEKATQQLSTAAVSLWNTPAFVEREVRRNKVLVLEKPPVGGGKKKKVLPGLTVRNLKDLLSAEEGSGGEKTHATSLWRRPSPMMERMFLALSSTRRETQSPQSPLSPISPMTMQREEKVVVVDVPSSPQASPATPSPSPSSPPLAKDKAKEKEKDEKHHNHNHNPFSAVLRIPSLRRHLKPVTSPVHAHAWEAQNHTMAEDEGSVGGSGSSASGSNRGSSGGGARRGSASGERREMPGAARPGAEWLRRKGLVG